MPFLDLRLRLLCRGAVPRQLVCPRVFAVEGQWCRDLQVSVEFLSFCCRVSVDPVCRVRVFAYEDVVFEVTFVVSLSLQDSVSVPFIY